MHDILSKTIHNTLEDLHQLCQATIDFGKPRGLGPAEINAVNLVLEELITNTIKFGYSDAVPHEIQVRLEINPADIGLLVVDDGKEFNPLLVPAPDINRPLEELPIGGLGIFLVRKTATALDYRRENGKNSLAIRINRTKLRAG